jgi:hypothetical protein
MISIKVNPPSAAARRFDRVLRLQTGQFIATASVSVSGQA